MYIQLFEIYYNHPALSVVSVTQSQPQSKNIKWKIPEKKLVLNCASFWVAL